MTQRFLFRSMVLFLLVVCLFPKISIAQQESTEKIISFHSDINIEKSGLMKVAEHIKIYANGDEFKRGLVRTIPLYRKDKYGNKMNIDFKITGILKNGQKEDFFTKEEAGERSMYIGKKEVLLEPGIYDYEIRYETKGHVGFFDGYDELYWNVTGNDWNFSIDSASATIHFPEGAKAGNTACYTGVRGAKEHNCSFTTAADGSVTFSSTGRLAENEGLTIAAAFTPGIIIRPTFQEKLFTEYRPIVVTILLLIALAGWYYYSWNRFGRDPEKPLVIPTFNVPNDVSPATLRYLYKQKTDQKAFAIAVINMAVKKVIKISKGEDKNSDYLLQRDSANTTILAKEEKSVYNKLLGKRAKITISEAYAVEISDAKSALEKDLKQQVNLKDYFLKHSKQIVFSSLITAAAVILFMIFVQGGFIGLLLFFTPFLAVGATTIYFGIKNLINTYGLSLFLIFFGLAFGGIPLYMLLTQVHNIAIVPLVFIIAVTVMFITYIYLIKAPTAFGSRLLSEIEGFKMYLQTAEQHRLNLLNPPDLSPQLFEKFLPYAMALDVENEWGAKFESILSNVDYQPDWYNGETFPYRTLGVAMSQPFSKALQQSIPSSSSSGSISGSSGSSSWSSGSSSSSGSSGGGGGGGGGGGW